jgi:hypothetical protein
MALKVDVTIRDQPLDLRARIVTEQGDQYPVQALPIEFGGNRERAALGSGLWALGHRFMVHRKQQAPKGGKP